MPLILTINGQSRTFNELEAGSTIADLVAELALKSDRVAIERNGTLAPRGRWRETLIEENDKLEVVHFVGGGQC